MVRRSPVIADGIESLRQVLGRVRLVSRRGTYLDAVQTEKARQLAGDTVP
jgi:hypothetical protein